LLLNMERSGMPYNDKELFEEIEELDEDLTEEHVSVIRMTLQKEFDLLTKDNNPQQTLLELELRFQNSG
jgi:hypothetical protein